MHAVVPDHPSPLGSGELSEFVEHFPGMLFVSGAGVGWPLRWVSHGCLFLTGLHPRELLEQGGSRYGEMVVGGERGLQLTALAESDDAPETYILEYCIAAFDGTQRWVMEQGRFVRDEEDIVSRVEGIVSDITPLKERQVSLVASENRLREIFENTAEGIFQSSVDGAYKSVNPALARIYGFESPAAMMESLTDIGQQLYVNPERRDEFVVLLERSDRVRNFESKVWHREGRAIWISENARAVRDHRGQLLYYEGTVEDITERKLAQDALARERNMLRTVIDAWPEIVYVKDPQGYYTLSNLAHTRNLGLTATSEIVGRKPEDFFLPNRAARLGREDFEVMQSGHAVIDREEVRISDNNEQRWFLTSKLPLCDADGTVTGLVSLSRDITQHKHATEQLRQSQKMEAIGRLAGGVAHDFNNILTTIIGYSELIAAQVAKDPDLLQEIGHVHAGAVRASALTQQLLAFSRKQLAVTKPLNLNNLIGGMQAMLKGIVGPEIRLDLCLAPVLALVKADIHQMEQVIMNLVVNARDAVRERGEILIETSEVYVDGISRSQKLEVVPGQYVCLRVCDNGCGIPKEIQHRVYEPFFTTKLQGQGTGLGLSTVYGIVEQSGGHILFHSVPDEGTTFTIYLPAEDKLSEDQIVGEVELKSMPGNEVILVAEDDPSVRELTVTVLTELGYRVYSAEDGEDALGVLAKPDMPKPDLLITDVVMPRMGGKALAEHVRKLLPTTRILFASGYNEEEMLHRGIKSESIAFIAKPYSIGKFVQRVREVLDEPSPEPTGELAN